MNTFDEIKLKIYESYSDGSLSSNQKEILLNYITEKEEDYIHHMEKKKAAADRLGVDIDDLPNKKYKKDPKKADLYYAGKEKITEDEIENYTDEDFMRDMEFLMNGD